MNKLYILLASAAAFTLSAPAFAADESVKSETKIEKDSKGNLDEKNVTVTKDASGKTTDKKTVVVDVDSKGNTEKTTETKNVHSTGILSKDDKVTTKDTEKTKDGQLTTTHEKKVDGKTVESTTDTAPKQ